MKQERTLEAKCKRRGRRGIRFAPALLAIGVTLSMSASVCAAEAQHGRGAGHMHL